MSPSPGKFLRSTRLHPLSVGVALLVLAVSAHGETIHLKNGRIILADRVREVNGRVEYAIGENTYALPKSSVERIDSGGAPISLSHPDTAALPPVAAEITSTPPEGIANRIIHDGKVDVEQLGTLEREGNKEIAASGYFLAAKNEILHGSLESAARYLERARVLLPENSALLANQASVSAQMGKMAEAASFAERATRMDPTNASAFSMLGYADLQLGKTKEAIRALKRALELQPNPSTEELLSKAARELQTEGSFAEEATSHFKLRFEGGQAAALLRRQILESLETDFNDLVRELNFYPRESISVVLYTDQQFFDVTQAPSWAGALNDGKLRLPINGVTAVDTQFARVLKHELTHSFITQLSRGRCPTWLHEGVAQIMEPRSASSEGRNLAAIYLEHQNIPLNQLEGSFGRFSPEAASIAYSESLLSVEYIRDAYGMSDVALILKRIGEGQSTESALRSSIHSGYAQFEEELTAYLKRTYGS